jgi:hypothetical protein
VSLLVELEDVPTDFLFGFPVVTDAAAQGTARFSQSSAVAIVSDVVS